MDCSKAREAFPALLDGELDAEHRAEVEGHLAECADCLREREAFERDVPRERPTRIQFPRSRHQPRRMWPLLMSAALFLMMGGMAAVQLHRARPVHYTFVEIQEPLAAAEGVQRLETVKEVGGRHFTLQEGGWREAGYAGEAAEVVARGSEAFVELEAEYPAVRVILETLPGPVIVRLGGRWYEVRPSEGAQPSPES